MFSLISNLYLVHHSVAEPPTAGRLSSVGFELSFPTHLNHASSAAHSWASILDRVVGLSLGVGYSITTAFSAEDTAKVWRVRKQERTRDRGVDEESRRGAYRGDNNCFLFHGRLV